MAERWRAGAFVWRELSTGDVDGARRFYGELFGWSFKPEDMGPAGIYWLAERGGRQLCGMVQKPAATPAAWLSYVLVDDVDAAAARCLAAGGTVVRAAQDIPDIGRFAVIADPWGASLAPFRSRGGEAAETPRPSAGSFCWETLVAPDPKAALGFYSQVIGFGTAPAPSGEGTLFTAGEDMVADVQTARPEAPARWTSYVQVEQAEAWRDRAVRLGGKVVVPRVEVPKVGTVAFVTDPGGAGLGLFQLR